MTTVQNGTTTKTLSWTPVKMEIPEPINKGTIPSNVVGKMINSATNPVHIRIVGELGAIQKKYSDEYQKSKGEGDWKDKVKIKGEKVEFKLTPDVFAKFSDEDKKIIRETILKSNEEAKVKYDRTLAKLNEDKKYYIDVVKGADKVSLDKVEQKLKDMEAKKPTLIGTITELIKALNAHKPRKLTSAVNTCVGILVENLTSDIMQTLFKEAKKDGATKNVVWGHMGMFHEKYDYSYKPFINAKLPGVFTGADTDIKTNSYKTAVAGIKKVLSEDGITFDQGSFEKGLGVFMFKVTNVFLNCIVDMHESVRLTANDVLSHIKVAFKFSGWYINPDIYKRVEKFIDDTNHSKKTKNGTIPPQVVS